MIQCKESKKVEFDNRMSVTHDTIVIEHQLCMGAKVGGLGSPNPPPHEFWREVFFLGGGG